MNKLQRDSHIFSLAMSKVYDFSFALCGFLQKVSLPKKLFLLYSFFFARRIIAHNVTFFFYCIVIPFSSFFPEVIIPKWGVFYIPTVITILNSIGTPRFDTSHKFHLYWAMAEWSLPLYILKWFNFYRSLHLIVIWIFFENVMSLHRCKAVFIGLFEAGRVNEWVVTEKLGKALKTKQVSTAAKRSSNKFWQR